MRSAQADLPIYCEVPKCRRISTMTYSNHRLCGDHYKYMTTAELHALWRDARSDGCGCVTCVGYKEERSA